MELEEIMTIEEAIKHAEEVADKYSATFPNCDCAKEHRQLATWLKELLEYKSQPEIIHCCECKFFRANMSPDGYIPKGAFEFECKHWNGSCDPTDFCSYGEKINE